MAPERGEALSLPPGGPRPTDGIPYHGCRASGASPVEGVTRPTDAARGAVSGLLGHLFDQRMELFQGVLGPAMILVQIAELEPDGPLQGRTMAEPGQ
jgi:hypothetical protein